VIAFNIRPLSNRTGTGFLLATTHEAITEDLSPTLHVRCRLDGEILAVRNNESSGSDPESPHPLKKKQSPSPPTSGSPPRPNPTGRTSLGGIIGAGRSGSLGL